MRTVICMPTYNERENLPSLVEEIVATTAIDVIILDDDSPDGTGRVADLLAEKFEGVTAVHRAKKQGVGAAYKDGFSRALALGYEQIVQMDADFSHQPRYLPDLLSELETADVVVGSRYVEGGGIENCKARRRMISRVSNTAAGAVLGLPVKDATAGFVAWRANVLSAIDYESIPGEGYAFQVELKHRAHRRGFKVVEVPILFWDRVAGKSKLEASAARAMIRVLRMRSEG
jgi:dolichol-phosphate mannosyltransferase